MTKADLKAVVNFFEATTLIFFTECLFGALDGFAPFLSMALRESFLTIKDEFTITAPGPGAYNPRVSNYTKGASTLANREQRFIEKADETPGPGSYELSRQSDWLKEKYAMRCPATAVSFIFVLNSFSY